MRRPWTMWWLLLALVATPVAGKGPRIAIFSFVDKAGFQGDWQLADDVPRLLGQRLTDLSSLQVVDADSVHMARKVARAAGQRGASLMAAVGGTLQADYVLRGVVTACGVRRVLAGDPNTGGYRSFTYAVGVEDVELMRIATATVVRTMSVVRDTVMRPFELNLFGRPTEHDREFEQLFKVEFGSETFFELGFGRFVRVVLDELANEVISTIYDRRPLILSRDGARVLAVDDERVFLGIGVDDYLESGDVVPILDADGERVALVVIGEIIGPHLSSAHLRSVGEGWQSGQIEVGQRLGQRLAPDAMPSD